MKTPRRWPVALLLWLAACAEYAVPAEHVQSANGAIAEATAAGADHSARARPYVSLARTELAQAMRSSGKGADLLVLRAQVDAELAVALARQDRLEDEASQAVGRARTLSASQPRP